MNATLQRRPQKATVALSEGVGSGCYGPFNNQNLPIPIALWLFSPHRRCMGEVDLEEMVENDDDNELTTTEKVVAPGPPIPLQYEAHEWKQPQKQMHDTSDTSETCSSSSSISSFSSSPPLTCRKLKEKTSGDQLQGKGRVATCKMKRQTSSASSSSDSSCARMISVTEAMGGAGWEIMDTSPPVPVITRKYYCPQDTHEEESMYLHDLADNETTTTAGISALTPLSVWQDSAKTVETSRTDYANSFSYCLQAPPKVRECRRGDHTSWEISLLGNGSFEKQAVKDFHQEKNLVNYEEDDALLLPPSLLELLVQQQQVLLQRKQEKQSSLLTLHDEKEELDDDEKTVRTGSGENTSRRRSSDFRKENPTQNGHLDPSTRYSQRRMKKRSVRGSSSRYLKHDSHQHTNRWEHQQKGPSEILKDATENSVQTDSLFSLASITSSQGFVERIHTRATGSRSGIVHKAKPKDSSGISPTKATKLSSPSIGKKSLLKSSFTDSYVRKYNRSAVKLVAGSHKRQGRHSRQKQPKNIVEQKAAAPGAQSLLVDDAEHQRIHQEYYLRKVVVAEEDKEKSCGKKTTKRKDSVKASPGISTPTQVADAQPAVGNTPLHLSCLLKRSSSMILRDIQCHPKQAKKLNGNGELPLHYACINQSHERGVSYRVVKALLDVHPLGARVETPDVRCLPLHLYCLVGVRSLRVVKNLVEIYPKGVAVQAEFAVARRKKRKFSGKPGEGSRSGFHGGRSQVDDGNEEETIELELGWSPLHVVVANHENCGLGDTVGAQNDGRKARPNASSAVTLSNVVQIMVQSCPDSVYLKTSLGRTALDCAYEEHDALVNECYKLAALKNQYNIQNVTLRKKKMQLAAAVEEMRKVIQLLKVYMMLDDEKDDLEEGHKGTHGLDQHRTKGTEKGVPGQAREGSRTTFTREDLASV